MCSRRKLDCVFESTPGEQTLLGLLTRAAEFNDRPTAFVREKEPTKCWRAKVYRPVNLDCIDTSCRCCVQRRACHTVAKIDALQLIKFLLHYWSLRSSKVDDLHLIRKGVCDFLLMINSKIRPISHYLSTVHPRQTDEKQTTTMPRTPYSVAVARQKLMIT